MAMELEMKLAVGDLQLLDCLLCDDVVRKKMTDGFSYIKMETTYFDTEELALSGRKQTLRVRKENERSVVTFKTPGEGYARGEWECEGDVLEEALPELVKQGAPAELAELSDLIPVCSAQFTRILAHLQLEDGTVCELCGDIGNLLGGGRAEPLCELELELKDGSADTMLAYGRMLMERYHLSEEPKSKFARAMALRI